MPGKWWSLQSILQGIIIRTVCMYVRKNITAKLYEGIGFRCIHTLLMFYENTGFTDFMSISFDKLKEYI